MLFCSPFCFDDQMTMCRSPLLLQMYFNKSFRFERIMNRPRCRTPSNRAQHNVYILEPRNVFDILRVACREHSTVFQPAKCVCVCMINNGTNNDRQIFVFFSSFTFLCRCRRHRHLAPLRTTHILCAMTMCASARCLKRVADVVVILFCHCMREKYKI